MAKKKINFSELTLPQILCFFSGLALAVLGGVLSIILFASSLYEDGQEYPVSMTTNSVQQICQACVVKEGESLWLATGNRQIEYTDIAIVVSVKPQDGSELFENETSFVIVNLRNQTGGRVYYRLATPEKQYGKAVDISVQKLGADMMEQPFSIMLRHYNGMQFNSFYILLFVLGLALIILSTRLKGKNG